MHLFVSIIILNHAYYGKVQFYVQYTGLVKDCGLKSSSLLPFQMGNKCPWQSSLAIWVNCVQIDVLNLLIYRVLDFYHNLGNNCLYHYT